METQFIVCDFRFDHFLNLFLTDFLAFSVLNLIYFHRLAEALHLFLLLWFYCTLTVRESILVVNGSRIRGWWVMHHYISAFLVGVHIIWPTASDGYDRFRNLTVWFSLLVSLVQVNKLKSGRPMRSARSHITSFRLCNTLIKVGYFIDYDRWGK